MQGLADHFRIRIICVFKMQPFKLLAVLTFILCSLPFNANAKLSNSKIAEMTDIQNLKAIEDTSKPLLRLPVETRWAQAPNHILPAGAEMFVLEGNPDNPAPYIIRLKLPPNYKLPAHWNLSDEHLTVISGALNLGIGDKLEVNNGKLLPSGSYARIPARVHHFAWTGDSETVIQLNGMGPWALNYIETIANVDLNPNPNSDSQANSDPGMVNIPSNVLPEKPIKLE